MKKMTILLCLLLLMQSILCCGVYADEVYATRINVKGRCNYPELGLVESEPWTETIENEFAGHRYLWHLCKAKSLYSYLCTIEYDENCYDKYNSDRLEFSVSLSDGSTKTIVIDGGRIDVDGRYYQINPEKYDELLRMVLGRKHLPFKVLDGDKRKYLPYNCDESWFLSDITNKRYEGAQAEYLWHFLGSMTFTYDGCFDYENKDSMNFIAETSANGEFWEMRMDSQRFWLVDGYHPLSFYKVDPQEYIEFIEAHQRALNIDSELDFFNSTWASPHIVYAIHNGFLNEYNKVNYKKAIDRSEFCNIVYNAFGNGEAYEGEPAFSDTENPKIASLCEMGIISGMGDGTFSPHTNLTREQAAVVFAGLAKLGGKKPGETQKAYEDEPMISDWAKEAVDYVSSIGVMRGDDSGSFNPKGEITKQEALVVLVLLKDENAGRSSKALLPVNDKIDEKLGGLTPIWYRGIIYYMMNEEASYEREVVEEYQIADSISFLGDKFINIKVFEDGTGELTHRYFGNKMEFNPLTKEQVSLLVECFEKNNFWDIPSIHPEELQGSDGNRVFMEGISGDKYNLISMWYPDDKYEIKKIYNEVASLCEEWGLIKE